MRTIKLLSGVVLAVALNAAQADAPPCERLFQEGVSHFEAGEYALAVNYFDQAIQIAPEPRTTDGYIPYIYLAAAQFKLGNVRSAREALIQSQIYGKAAEVEAGRQLMDQYAVAVMSAPPVDAVPQASPEASPVGAENLALNNDQAELIRDRVLKRCALSENVAQNKLPWYFHYLLGLEYESAGDAGRALDAFLLGANLRDAPARNKRLYGMWYMDYLPYFQIARTRAALGQWQSAKDALDLSLKSGEFSPSDPDFGTFSALDALVENNLNRGDS